MTVLVTGAAGFIGYHTCKALLARGERVAGIDNLNDYYDVTIKHQRLADLRASAPEGTFSFVEGDISEIDDLQPLIDEIDNITAIVHLAAQAGVRYSIQNPRAYTKTNVDGQLAMLEVARNLKDLKHFVYASSSSVYGANEDLPYSVADRVDRPVSLYAATKRAGELMAHSYSHLFDIPTTGLRFFTVYGPWGRPDMAYWLFTKKILAGEPIEIFNAGDMQRDFTYIDDIVAGVLAALDRPPTGDVPWKVYNLGNNETVKLTDFVTALENAIGKKAELIMKPMQLGDVKATYADIDVSQQDLGFAPKTSIDDGLRLFIDWYRHYHGNLNEQ